MRTVAIIFLFAMTIAVFGATVYVTPNGSGAKNGSSYANALDGLDSVDSVVTLTSGDTLYVCGTHSDTNQACLMPTGTTVRMDYGPDPGVLTGGKIWIKNGASNVLFRACNFVNQYRLVWYTNNIYITFDGCTFTNNCYMDLDYGNDHWTFMNCEFGNGFFGIYAHLDLHPMSANFLTVSNCFIHDMDTAEFPNNDGHGIGIQGSSNCTITHNRIERTGTAIEFWTDTQPMSNNVVSFNFIKDIHIITGGTTGHGIVFSPNSTGLAISNKVYGNIIVNVGIGKTGNTQGFGVSFSRDDEIEVLNNTISNCTRGVSFSGAGSTGYILNNLIVSASQYSVSAVGGGTVSDYNLYFPTNNTFYTSGTHDAHSIVSDPLFVSTPQTNALDFRVEVGSYAIGTATPLNSVFTVDYSGTVRGSVWDIGAFEYVRPPSAALIGTAIFNGATFQ